MAHEVRGAERAGVTETARTWEGLGLLRRGGDEAFPRSPQGISGQREVGAELGGSGCEGNDPARPVFNPGEEGAFLWLDRPGPRPRMLGVDGCTLGICDTAFQPCFKTFNLPDKPHRHYSSAFFFLLFFPFLHFI